MSCSFLQRTNLPKRIQDLLHVGGDFRPRRVVFFAHGVHDLFLGSISSPLGASDYERKRIEEYEARAGKALKLAGVLTAVVIRVITLLPIKILE